MAEKLTHKRVQGLRSLHKRIEIRDAEVRNLILRVTPAGAKSWSVQFRVKGRTKTQRQTLGPFPDVPIADARRRARSIICIAAEGRDPIAEARAEAAAVTRNALTFAHLLDEYIARRQDVVSIHEVERGGGGDAVRRTYPPTSFTTPPGPDKANPPTGG